MIGKLTSKDKIALLYMTTLSIVAVLYGFSIIPSPSTENLISTDHKRVVDLANIQASVDDYYQSNSVLPPSLDEMTTNINDTTTPLEKNDPKTKQPYSYQVISPYAYKLCATFTNNSYNENPNNSDTVNPDYATYSSDFKHPAGYYCFTERETPANAPLPTYPTQYPCKKGAMCPMIPAHASPAIYNGSTLSPSQDQAGGSAQ